MFRGGRWRGFTSIPNTMYFIMATMTTVGYGENYPITPGGKIACGFCMLCGTFVLGLPIVVVGISFDEAFKEADKKKEEAKKKVRESTFRARATGDLQSDVCGADGLCRVCQNDDQSKVSLTPCAVL